jgi:hypothetical protein
MAIVECTELEVVVGYIEFKAIAGCTALKGCKRTE